MCCYCCVLCYVLGVGFDVWGSDCYFGCDWGVGGSYFCYCVVWWWSGDVLVVVWCVLIVGWVCGWGGVVGVVVVVGLENYLWGIGGGR